MESAQAATQPTGALGDGFHPVADILSQAQLLIDNAPISSAAYAAWRTAADGVLSTAFGPNSALTKAVRERGNMPTNFFGASMAEVILRLSNERKERMIRMKAAIESYLAPPKAAPGKETASVQSGG